MQTPTPAVRWPPRRVPCDPTSSSPVSDRLWDSTPSDVEIKLITAASRLAHLTLPTNASSPQMLEALLAGLEDAAIAFDALDFRKDIRAAAAGNEQLVDIERQSRDLVRHIDFLRIRATSNAESDSSITEDDIRLAQQIVAAVDGILKTIEQAREDVDIALEWIELRDVVMADLVDEIANGQDVAMELEGYRLQKHSEWPIPQNAAVNSVKGLVESMKQSPVPGHGRFVCLSEEDKKQNRILLNLFKKIQPLRTSLEFLDMRIVEFSQRIGTKFSSSLEDLTTQREELDAKWSKLSADAELIKKEFGEDRWVALLIDSGNQARKLMSGLEQQMSSLLDISSVEAVVGSPAPLSSSQRIQQYELSAKEHIPETLKILSLLERATRDKVTTSNEVAREIAHLKNFWADFEEHVSEIDQKYGLDISNVIGEHTVRDRSSRVSQRSSSIMSFRGSRSRSRSSCSATSSVDSIAEASSPDYLRSSSPFDEDPSMRTPMPLNGKRKQSLYTPTLSKTSQLDLQHPKIQATPRSAIPIPKRSLQTPKVSASVSPCKIPRPATPSDRKRRASSIPQPKYSAVPVPVIAPEAAASESHPASPQRTGNFAAPTLSSTLKKKTSTRELQQKPGTVMATPQRKQSISSATPVGMTDTMRKARKSSLIPQTPQSISKVKATAARRQSTAASKDPFGPTSTTTLNHRASTPNLNRKASAANISAPMEAKKVPPLPAHPKSPAKKINASAAYKLSTVAAMSPNSQQKFYIKYGPGDEDFTSAGSGDVPTAPTMAPKMMARTTAGSGAPTLSPKKSMPNMSAQKPRWR